MPDGILLHLGCLGEVDIGHLLSSHFAQHGVDRRFVPQKLKEGIVRRPPLFHIDRNEMAQDFDGLTSCRKGLGHEHGQNPQHLVVAQREQLREQLGKVDRAVFRRAQVTLAFLCARP
jgi:hypothetical protein